MADCNLVLTELKVLNVAQPNAHNILFNGKNLENRSMSTSTRGTIAIYASKKFSKQRFERQEVLEVKREECSFGCIIGFVDVVDCLVESQISEDNKTWFHGPYAYVLTNPRALAEPIEVTPPQGAVIWWTLDGPAVEECLKQIDRHSIVPITIQERAKDAPAPTIHDEIKIPMNPSPALQKIVGAKPISLKKALQKVIAYIAEFELYDEATQVITCDAVLLEILHAPVAELKDFRELIAGHLKA